MTEELMNNLILICFLGVMVWCLIFRVIMAKSDKLLAEAKKNGWVTTGYEAGSKFIQGGREYTGPARKHRLKVTYVYQIHGVKYKKKITYSDDPCGYTGPTGYTSKLTLYYNPQNPKKAYTAEELSKERKMGNGCLMTMIAPFILTAIFSIILHKLF